MSVVIERMNICYFVNKIVVIIKVTIVICRSLWKMFKHLVTRFVNYANNMEKVLLLFIIAI